MKRATELHREVAVPAAAFTALGRALRDQAGPLAAIHGLHAAGYGAGEALYEGLEESLGAPLKGSTDGRAFWSAMTRFLERRGWGRLEHSTPHPGIGLLTSRDWAEAEGGEGSQPSCAFSVGFLSHMLTRVAEQPVAVLEVGCRAAGAQACSFAYGSEGTIHDLYGVLVEGETIEHALSAL
jgi:predicted hydrocarbon binding protein